MAYTDVSHLMVEVERILLTDWDPIGVKGEPMAEGEYGTYAGIVSAMLLRGASEGAIANYLEEIQTRHMGLKPVPGSTKKAAHACVTLLSAQ